MGSPLSTSRFVVEVDGRPVAVSEVVGLALVRGQKPAGAVTLRRAAGVDRTLLDWAREPADRVVVLTLVGPRGDAAAGYRLEGARPVSWHGPELNATSTEIAMEELVLSVERIDLR